MILLLSGDENIAGIIFVFSLAIYFPAISFLFLALIYRKRKPKSAQNLAIAALLYVIIISTGIGLVIG